MNAGTIVEDLPNGTELLENQVAGHIFQVGTDEIGMLKDQRDGCVMKAAVKPLCGVREIQFYERLRRKNEVDSHTAMLRELVPDYQGTVKCMFRGKLIDFIKLADITHGMSEPCIIDIKIGKRTWDPFASIDKQKAEEQKYKACKHTLGFCIPGFQVYDLKSGRIKRYGKEYGKKLTAENVKDALKIYLNAEAGLCRSLIMKFLTTLWMIQSWARSQTSLRLYSSSLLLAYDARILKNQLLFSRSTNDTISEHTNSSTPIDATNSDQSLSNSTPYKHKNGLANGNGLNGTAHHTNATGETIQLYKQLQRNRSAHNNYDKDMEDIRKNYTFLLDNLIDDCNGTKEWTFVKMIDFAHAFEAEDDSIDKNYLFGIENLVRIFEQFLKECTN